MSIALLSVFYIVGVIPVVAENSSSVQTAQTSIQTSLALSTQPYGIQSTLPPLQRSYQQLLSSALLLNSSTAEPVVLPTAVVSNIQTVRRLSLSTVLEMPSSKSITKVSSPISSASGSLRPATANATLAVSKSPQSISTTSAIAPSFSEISSHVTSSHSSNAPYSTTLSRVNQEADDLSLHSLSLSPTASSSPVAKSGSYGVGKPQSFSTVQHNPSSSEDASAILIQNALSTSMTYNQTHCTNLFATCQINTRTTSTTSSQYRYGSAISSNNVTLSLKEPVRSSYITGEHPQTNISRTSFPSVTPFSVSSSFSDSLLVSNTTRRYDVASSTFVDALSPSILLNTVLPSATFGRLMLPDSDSVTSLLTPHTYVEAASVSSSVSSSGVIAEVSSILSAGNHSKQSSIQSGTSTSVYTPITDIRLPSSTAIDSSRLEHTQMTDFRTSPSIDIYTSRIAKTPIAIFSQSSPSAIDKSMVIHTSMTKFSQPLSSERDVFEGSFSTVSFISGSSTLTLSSVLSSLTQETASPSLSPDVQSSNYVHVSPSSSVKLSSTTSKLSERALSTPTLAFNDSIVLSSVLATLLNISFRASETTVRSVSTIDTRSEKLSSTRSEYATVFPTVVEVSTPTSLFLVSSSITPVVQTMPDIKFIFEFEGECNRLILNAKLQIEFWQALIAVLSIESSVHIHKENVQPVDLTCKPFLVILIITNLNFNDYTKLMENNSTITNIGVPILDDMSVIEYEVKSVQVIPLAKGDTKKHKEKKQKLETADVIIIVMAGILFGFLLCMCVVIGCRECYRRRRAASFNLLDVPHVNLDMEEFTLTKIPRPQMIYRENIPRAPASSIANGSSYNRPKHLPVSEMDIHKTNGTHPVNADSIQVRIQPHPDGVVVGVTCTPPRSPTRDSSASDASDSSPCSEASDPSQQALLKTNCPQHGMANPNFECDEELKVIDSNKYVIKEDEVEAFL